MSYCTNCKHACTVSNCIEFRSIYGIAFALTKFLADFARGTYFIPLMQPSCKKVRIIVPNKINISNTIHELVIVQL